MTKFFDAPREQRDILPGKLTIGRPSPGDGEPYVSIQLTDDRSGARFVEARIGYADFTAALMGLSQIAVEFATAGLAVVGLQREHKSETVTIPESAFGYDERHIAAMRAAEPFEVDGWRYSGPREKSSSWSQGQWVSDHAGNYIVRLPFIRHVPYGQSADAEPDRADRAARADQPIRRRRRKPDEA